MPEARLIRQCAPTLAGIKTGSLFLFPPCFDSDLHATLRHWNRQLAPNGLYIVPLRTNQKGCLLYLYRPNLLSADLDVPSAVQLLQRSGYRTGSPARCITQLMRRLREQTQFPHEIGLFLGYPPEDVRGFIDNRGHHFKCAGLWKVYADADTARQTFRQYQLCTASYCARWAAGAPLEQLIVKD